MLPCLAGLCLLCGCARLDDITGEPAFTDEAEGAQQFALHASPFPQQDMPRAPRAQSSLWTSSSASLLGDRRATRRGDILTVTIEIDEGAELMSATDTARRSSSNGSLAQLLGLPQHLSRGMPAGASMENYLDAGSRSAFSGDGSISRSERLNLRIAAVIVDELPSGALRIEGSQEVRINGELRMLNLSGFIRPGDVSRKNEITYDKIASARIHYGGRGIINGAQRMPWGQAIQNSITPF